MKVAVIGTGYVGLVAGACFADTGNTVVCVDRDEKKVQALREGRIPIYEPGLEDIVKRNVAEKRLSFTTSAADAVKACEVIFMAVGTPSLPTGEADLSFLKAAVEDVARSMDGYRLIVNKSTVPIGTHQRVREWIEAATQKPFDVVSNPEFLKEGSAIDDFLRPDRVVIGTTSETAFQKMVELYAPFVRQGNPILRMHPVSAEVSKYACNAFLATRISFMNELSSLTEKVGADIEDVRKGMVTDERIGRHFLYAGVGYGGSCFPKDVKALLATAEKNDVRLGIVQAAEDANERQKKHLLGHVTRKFGSDLKGLTFAVWGIAFKPNTDDIREAPALVMIPELVKRGARVQVFDPVAMPNAREVLTSDVCFAASSYEACRGADALVLLTEWNEFRNPETQRLLELLKQPVIFDGRNILDRERFTRSGFEVFGVGRGVGRGIGRGIGQA